jgi:hypothetical protein
LLESNLVSSEPGSRGHLDCAWKEVVDIPYNVLWELSIIQPVELLFLLHRRHEPIYELGNHIPYQLRGHAWNDAVKIATTGETIYFADRYGDPGWKHMLRKIKELRREFPQLRIPLTLASAHIRADAREHE